MDDEKGDEPLERKVKKNLETDGITFQCDLTDVELNEPVKKKRRAVMEDSDKEDIASTTISSLSKSTKSSKSTDAAPPDNIKKSTPKLADEDPPSGEETDTGSVEDEPDSKTTKKAAQKLSILSLEIY